MLTCNRKPSSYYYSRSGHGRMGGGGGNGTTVSGATEMYFGDGMAGGLRANRSGGGGSGAAFRVQGGESAQLHYSSVSNLATAGKSAGGLAASSGLSGSRRESDFLSPTHALIGRYETKSGGGGGGGGGQRNGSLLRTSASIGSRLTAEAVVVAVVAAPNEEGNEGKESNGCTRSTSKSEGLGEGGGGR